MGARTVYGTMETTLPQDDISSRSYPLVQLVLERAYAI